MQIKIWFYYCRYYAFLESRFAVPPKVKPPPYFEIDEECIMEEMNLNDVSINNFCGDLNAGTIPKNPMGQQIHGEPYPL